MLLWLELTRTCWLPSPISGSSLPILAAVVTILNLMCNGYLTARPVVVYNGVVISGVWVGTVPVEDLVYGWILVWGVVKVYEKSDKIK